MVISLQEKKKIKSIFPEQYYEATYFLGERYLALLLVEMLQNLGVIDSLRLGCSFSDLVKEGKVVDNTAFSFYWILEFLVKTKLVRKVVKEDKVYYCFCTEEIPMSSRRIKKQILKIEANVRWSCEMMEHVVKNYPDFLRGEKKGFEILFVLDRMDLWMRYFSNLNKGYSVYNELGAFGLSKWIPDSKDQTILEVGGGTGYATVLALECFKRRNLTRNIKEYIFSDVSPIFLRTSSKIILDRHNVNLIFKKIDFNISLSLQGIPNESLDVVYGVNALHISKDIYFTLKEIHRVLKKNGVLIISECIRSAENELLVQEIIFNLLSDYSDDRTIDGKEGNRGFLYSDQWIKLFQESGFEKVEYAYNTSGETELRAKRPRLAMVIKGSKVK